MKNEVQVKMRSFLKFYSRASFKGYSVYDAFNSDFFKPFSKINIHIINVLVTQFFKRYPFNIRGFFRVKKSINPKSLGLALKGALLAEDKVLIDRCISSIKSTQINFKGFPCWGYNWDYYTLRGGTFPKDYPNAITTYFIADALLDYSKSEFSQDDWAISILNGIRNFFLQSLNRTAFSDGLCFSYSPADNKLIYNASALVTKFLVQSRTILNDLPGLGETIIDSTSFIFSRISEDGAWVYGEAINQQWVDSFHTEYMLEFCMSIKENIEGKPYVEAIRNAEAYYLNDFLKPDGICPYFNNQRSVYPINIHSIASMIIYLSKVGRVDDAESVLNWAFDNLYNSKKGFYFEKGKYFLNRNVYHRWNNSWMYLACQFFIKAKKC